MIRLFRIRLVGLLLLTTGVCLASYFYANRDYTHVRYRDVWQQANKSKAPSFYALLPTQPKPNVNGTIVTLERVQVAEDSLHYGQIRQDAAIVGLVLVALYAAVVGVNHATGSSKARHMDRRRD